MHPLNAQELDTCLELMQRLADSYRILPANERLNSLIRKLHRASKRQLRDQQISLREQLRQQDKALLATTQLVQEQRDLPPIHRLPLPDSTQELNQPESCYVCKTAYTRVHFFYHYLCPACAEFNYTMRSLHADLRGRTALVTGGRVKIGHQLVLRLLRDGAKVLVTTRFPHAAARRFFAESDSQDWLDRLHIYGLDLRDIPAVETFASYLLKNQPDLNILIHNAAQTIARPPGFYQELIEQEHNPQNFLSLPEMQLVARSAPTTLSLSDSSRLLPISGISQGLPLTHMHDREERVDPSQINSWLLPLEEVSAREMLEVQLVNSVAPFILNARLKPLLLRSSFARRFIVNVSAMEGQFARHKTIYHPHTNMAKAALNMLTHTSAAGYARDGIYMNSVDTGWVTDENPTPKRQRKQEELGFFAPLDIIDGMARVYHPIALGVDPAQTPLFGQFLKDYSPSKW